MLLTALSFPTDAGPLPAHVLGFKWQQTQLSALSSLSPCSHFQPHGFASPHNQFSLFGMQQRPTFSRPSQPPFIGLKAPALEGNQPAFPPTFWISTPSFPPTRSDSYSAVCLSTQMPIQISDSTCLCLQNQQAWLLIQASMGWAVPKPIHPPMHSTSSVSSTLPPTSS